MSGALDGFRILDMTQVVMGPFATQILADYGADVIKLEPPGGDTSRAIPPMKNPGMGYIYMHANRNKRSVVLDLKRPEGLQAFLRLAKTVDVLICNVRTKAMERLGVTYARLAEINPGVIYLNLVGFGDGPYADAPAYEDLFQALTGVSHMLTRAGAAHPMFVPLAYNDRACGLSAATIVLSALLARSRSGKGQHIVMPMFETMAQLVLGDHMGGRTFEPPQGAMGYQRILNDLRRPYETSDGHICMVLYADKHWRSYLEIVGKSHWMLEDPRLRSLTTRAQYAREIYEPITELMRSKTSAEWLQALTAADIPCAPVHTLETLMEDPHLAAIGFFKHVTHPSESHIVEMDPPTTWSETPPERRRHAPTLGEHSTEVLREAGLGDHEITALLEAKVTIQSKGSTDNRSTVTGDDH
jgi:crotonobetainyl-CoA:carnitine CoA-transferase CaiB-like acyl-CoA transferase